MVLFRSCLALLFTLRSGGTRKVKSSLNCIDSSSRKCVGLGWYLLNRETWKMWWRSDNYRGKATRYATGPIRFIIWKGPMNRGLNFLTLTALPIPIVSVIFKNMWSPSWKSNDFLLVSAYLFWRLWAVSILFQIFFICSVICLTKSSPKRLFSPGSYQHNGDWNFRPYNISYEATPILAW